MLQNTSVNVSLTSFPARIGFVPQVINSILAQSVKPDRILLWLGEGQFPNKEKDLPAELVALKEKGLEIMWFDDIRPHKKYFYTMQKYPDDITITVDDDVVYRSDTVETLLKSYKRFPFAVSCLRAHQITFGGDGTINGYRLWKRGVKNVHYPNHALLAVGVGGVLYPPRWFDNALFDKDFIINNCINADDLWLKANEVAGNVPVVLAAPSEDVKNIRGSQDEALYKSNDFNDVNDVQFAAILKHFETADGRNPVADMLRISAAALENSDNAADEGTKELLKLAEKELTDVKKSASYKIGRAVTLLPRCAKAFALCVQNNGFGYTVKLVVKRLLP
ncbi:MAG: hypothetical protein IKA10_05480 [Oscillospiraceae bacterium]|nr:hypothetical protein [Oscillospiraceae bacterium]